MSSLANALTIHEWQGFSAQDPAMAAREVARRLARTLSPEQHRAVFASNTPEAELVAQFERVSGTIAPFGGVPYALKDLFYTINEPIRAGSRFPSGVLPGRSKDSKLPHAMRGFGAILAARTHLHEFAYGLTGENPHYGDCEHPFAPGRTSGGSSSGSAVAVAAGVVPFAVGTDTGGSIRVPAAFCGLYGFRTQAGHPLIADAFPLAPSFDTAGWFTSVPEDLLLLNRYILGRPDHADRPLRGCYLDFESLGLPAEPEVERVVKAASEQFAPRADASTADQLRGAFQRSAESYGVLQSLEAYGVHKEWLDTHRSFYGEAVWSRIDRGRRWSADQEQTARARQALLKATWTSFFLTFDYLVMPVAPFPALTKAECTQENRDRLLALTTPASLAGLPLLTIPIALSDHLSTAVQVIVNNPLSPVIGALLKR